MAHCPCCSVTAGVGTAEGSHGDKCRAPGTSAEISLQGCLKTPDSDAATHPTVGEVTGSISSPQALRGDPSPSSPVPKAAPQPWSVTQRALGGDPEQGWAGGKAFLSFPMTQQTEMSIQPSPATARCSLFTLLTGKATLSTAHLQIFCQTLLKGWFS